MLKVKNNNISITRGDSGVVKVLPTNPDGTPYTVKEGDSIVLTVKTDTSTSKAIISLPVVDGQAVFKPAHTKGLKYGAYVYDVQLTTAEGDVYTFIPPHTFKILEEVTFDDG